MPTYKDNPKSRKLAPERINWKHEVVIQMAAIGLKQVEIAQRTGYVASWLSICMNDPKIQARIKEERIRLFDQDPDKMMRTSIPKAVKVIADTIDNENAATSLRVDTSFKLLDRVYGKPTQKIETEVGGFREFYEKLDRVFDKMENPSIEGAKEIVNAEYRTMEENEDGKESEVETTPEVGEVKATSAEINEYLDKSIGS